MSTVLAEMDKAELLLRQLKQCFKAVDFVGVDIGYAENQFQELHLEIKAIKQKVT